MILYRSPECTGYAELEKKKNKNNLEIHDNMLYKLSTMHKHQ